MRSRAFTGLAIAALALLPAMGGTWGTLTTPIPLTADDISKLQWLLNDFGVIEKTKTQVVQRLGPHPIHQFIVQQAFKMLERDPAYADGKSGLPGVMEVNAWDGIDRPPAGPTQRVPATPPGVPAALAPPTGAVGGPSADAEVLPNGSINREYNGAAHYWNPWLGCGQAPKVAGTYYDALVNSILANASMNDKAHYASYMCHYLADVSSAKHADYLEFTEEEVVKLEEIGKRWIENMVENESWLSRPEIAEARAVMETAANRYSGDKKAFWGRVAAEHFNQRVLRKASTIKVDIFATSLESSIATYLHALNEPRHGRARMAFYNYFDPYYYNGPIFDALSFSSEIDFKLTLPLGTHLMWETNPEHYALAQKTVNDNSSLLGGSLDSYYVNVRPKPAYWNPQVEGPEATKARQEYMADLVKACSIGAHGTDINGSNDFDDEFRPYMDNAIKHVYNGLRASITGLRVKAKYRPGANPKDCQLKITIRNIANDSVSLGAFRVLTREKGRLYSPTGWLFPPVGATLGPNGEHKVRVELYDAMAETKDPELWVEVRGEYSKTPDAGIRRARASADQAVQIVDLDSASKTTMEKGPLDLAIVFDVTGSMGSSIGAMKTQAAEVVAKLQKQSSDMRLALCWFRDSTSKDEADKGQPAFHVVPFGTDIDAKVAEMGSWEAKGGGDTPEDQLQGIKLILDLWMKEGITDRKPAKIIIVITDAKAHVPDTFGNTFQSIAKLAEEVDPAHIYPIVVGTDPDALSDANQLATLTTGKVSTSADYAKAADMLLEAVNTAVKEHPAEPAAPVDEDAPSSAGSALLFTGIGIFALGATAFLTSFFMRR